METVKGYPVICQNCLTVLGGMNEKHQLYYNKQLVVGIEQYIYDDGKITTLICPECNCMTQVIG